MSTEPLAVARSRAAKMLDVSPATLRAWSAADPQRGPRGIKLGDDRRARVIYPVAEIRAWLSDPAGYERRRNTP
jgi:hypothetical protein